MAKICLENVSLDYTVDLSQSMSFLSLMKSLKMARRSKREASKKIRALNEINLDILSGERVGLIGHNGAGKSTLLKVLAKIYPPQYGNVIVEGKIIPLFELATGFEMEASGWDNIRTRGLLLGMSAKEIEEKIESIGEFSGLGNFLNYPVRSYSSGMFVRLAFATSTAINPEILLLDEVMAAGDAAFIESAKKRMNELMGRASIVVFATHSLALLPSICQRTILLERGKIIADGPTQEVIDIYERTI